MGLRSDSSLRVQEDEIVLESLWIQFRQGSLLISHQIWNLESTSRPLRNILAPFVIVLKCWYQMSDSGGASFAISIQISFIR